ncbi:MAG TPA: phosphate ABC transporter substrate-binding protein [Ktedonobacteraceae bacterium]|jgi:phosphate transport system substrate-binding protein|nr:phosphate ABC transporter substrate-binding protein [Ktedonobacteraceae bacterium]
MLKKQWRSGLLVGLAAAITLFISACGSSTTGSGTPTTTTASTLGTPGAYNCIAGSLVADGSTALAPLVKVVAADYEKRCPAAHITVNLGGSKTGLADVESGSVGIGDSDIFASSSQSDLVDHQVAVVIFGMIVNSKVGITNLTTAQIQGIYAGTYKNWDQVGGPNLPIVVVSRPASSGTRATFQTYINKGPEKVTGPSSLISDSTGTVVTEVSQTAGAIGYAATGPAKKNSGVTILSIDGNAPTAANVESNTYKFWNIEHMYTKGQPSQLAQALIDYMASSDGKAAAASQDFVVLQQMQPAAVQAHQGH